jgi:hypothetical protein
MCLRPQSPRDAQRPGHGGGLTLFQFCVNTKVLADGHHYLQIDTTPGNQMVAAFLGL